MFQVTIDSQIFAKWPDYQALVIEATNLTNGPSPPEVVRLLCDAESAARSKFGEAPANSDPHIAAWRNAYSSFGAKPSKYLCSVEALLKRTLKGSELPSINLLVDLYNVVSIRHGLPVGGEDWDALASDVQLRLANGSEPFVTIQNGTEQVEHAESGEPIWVDSSGVTCRRWNWRQCHRTAFTATTTNAYFVLDRLAPYDTRSLNCAGDELIQFLRQFCPDARFTEKLWTAAEFAAI